MGDRIIFSLLILPFIIWGIVGVIFPVFMYKTTALNTLKKKPTQEEIRRSKTNGFVMLAIGVILVVITLIGGLGF
ncbi:hypothetical protein [Paenibacillus ihumii]|uniref:hypothetical protein n=1 Tax=Paenibacillus ihumii TaxID=687436 RepID=UPI0006D838F1|nr:hypothetical protein [Paenibacillus ihumii]